jgi:hypothetical protein
LVTSLNNNLTKPQIPVVRTAVRKSATVAAFDPNNLAMPIHVSPFSLVNSP